uniref:Uncharacterized protein n=1 Tax=Brugia timori TaxID=42155 RepID=A0A0R3RBN4_9BILA
MEGLEGLNAWRNEAVAATSAPTMAAAAHGISDLASVTQPQIDFSLFLYLFFIKSLEDHELLNE